ncbi:DVU_1553 family AMP-dependent CoA ligase [Desulfofalx alkaliphila]|uniref:DVU_1553 family AMP-dependent CoA ligase n=1 Tax=Desulfofalx alkaliphila TaxID=105483 RepID=UPI0004E0C69D|nr:AMP-binding protein [Desulfofalx alkaliphila]
MRVTPLHSWIAGKLGVSDTLLTRETIARYQLLKVQQTLELAVNRSLFYQKLLAGFRGKINKLADLKDLPFTTAEDIRKRPLHFLCVSQDEINRVVTLHSSGTTGEPKRLFFTKEDQELTVDFFRVGMSTLVGPGDRVLILLPGSRPGSVGDLLAKALERFGVNALPHGPVQDAGRTLRVVQEEGINALVGIPTQVLALARFKGAARSSIPLRLKSVLLSTDYVSQAIRRQLQLTWGCQVYAHYGMTEMGLGGGVECQARDGYHLREADLYFEIINPATLKPVEEGEEGEVVFTTLTRRGMPLIRYRTGDWARFMPGRCSCGTVLRRMGMVTGRVRGTVQLAGGSLTMGQLDEALFGVQSLLNFEASLSCSHGKDRLTISPIINSEFDDSICQEIRLALNTIPTIKRAVDSGNLEIDISRQPNHFTDTAAKRSIKDLRKG